MVSGYGSGRKCAGAEALSKTFLHAYFLQKVCIVTKSVALACDGAAADVAPEIHIDKSSVDPQPSHDRYDSSVHLTCILWPSPTLSRLADLGAWSSYDNAKYLGA